MVIPRGGSRIFSRGGADFQNNSKVFLITFFYFGQSIGFSELFQITLQTYLDQNFCAAGKCLKKGQKKTFLGNFWNILTKESRFLGARSPSKLVYIGAKGAFRKVLGSVNKNGYLKIVQRGTLWVGRGSNS